MNLKSIFDYNFEFDSTKHNKLVNSLLFVSLILLVLYGGYLRIGDQATRSLWVDELWRAHQIADSNNYIQLLKGNHFGHEGAVQLSEYILGKIGIFFFGKTEIAFRIWPLLFSVSAVFCFAYISINLFSSLFSIFSVFLFVVSNGYIQHAHGFKPYSFDVFLCLLLLSLCVRTKKNKLSWCAPLWTLVIFCWSSINGIFFLFLIPLFLFNNSKGVFLIRRNLPQIVLIILALIYQVTHALNLQSSGIFDFWKNVPIVPSYAVVVDKYNAIITNYIFSICAYASLKTTVMVFLISIVFSPILMLFRKNLLSYFLIFPFVTQCLLFAMGFYPIFTRVSSFYFPLLQLSLIYFLNYFWVKIIKIKQINFLEPLLISLLLLYSVQFIFSQKQMNFYEASKNKQEIKPLIDKLQSVPSDKQMLCLNYSAEHGIEFYNKSLKSKFEKCNFRDSKDRDRLRENFIEFVSKIKNSNSDSSIWIMYSHRVWQYSVFMQVLKDFGFKISYDDHREGAFLINFKK